MKPRHTPLGRHQPTTPTGPDHLEDMRRAAWHRQGILDVAVEDPRLDEWERQFAVNIATRLFGKRQADGQARPTEERPPGPR
ncbi:MAG: hypothetical protein ACT4P2_09470 [Pseudomonadota bacterium]